MDRIIKYMRHEFFGLKQKFGIELEIFGDKEKESGKVRFWICGKSFGQFHVLHSLVYLVKGLKRLTKDEGLLWDERLKNKTPEEIAETVWMISKDPLFLKEEEYSILREFQKFSFFFGEQFNTVSSIIFAKDNYYHFIWSENDDFTSHKFNPLKNLKYGKIEVSVLKDIVNRFLNWYEEYLFSKS